MKSKAIEAHVTSVRYAFDGSDMLLEYRNEEKKFYLLIPLKTHHIEVNDNNVHVDGTLIFSKWFYRTAEHQVVQFQGHMPFDYILRTIEQARMSKK